MEAMWISATGMGEFVAGEPALRKPPAPGIKKSSGETLLLALMPLQPAPNQGSAESIASNAILQFNLTWPV